MAHPLLAHLPAFRQEMIEELGSIRVSELEAGDEFGLLSVADGMAGAGFALWRVGEKAAAAEVVADAIENRDCQGGFVGASGPPDPAGVFYGVAGLDWIARVVGVESAPLEFAAPRDRMPEIYFARGGQLLAALIAESAGVESARAIAEEIAAEIAGGHDSGELAYASLDHTGLAHGVGGVLHAMLAWVRAGGAQPAWLEPSLHRLAEIGPPWPSFLSAPEGGTIGGLCNGSPGLVQLYVLAAEVLDSSFAATAEAAAADVAANPPRLANLCCGAVGEAYAFLAMSRISDSAPWFDQACERAAVAFGEEAPTIGLLTGDAALLCLADDLLEGNTRLPLIDPLDPP